MKIGLATIQKAQMPHKTNRPNIQRHSGSIFHFSLFTFHFKAWSLQALNRVLVADDRRAAVAA